MRPGLVATWNSISSSSFDGLYVNSVDRMALGKIRSVNVPTPGRAGSWHFTEEQGMRTITVDFTRVNTDVSTRRDNLVEIFNWLSAVGRRRLIFSDQPDRYWYGHVAGDFSVEEYVKLAKFQVEFECEPYAYALTVSEDCYTASAVDSQSFSYSGEIVLEPEVTIRPNGGNMTEVTFSLNDDAISWEGTVTSGNKLTISSISSTVLLGQSGDTMLTGAYDAANLSMQSVSGDFGVIVPGTNDWTISAAGSATSYTVCFKYRIRYR